MPSATADSANSAARVAVRLHVEAQDVLEIGEAVVAAEAEVVAEEAQHQREGQRLRDDREVDARHAAAEGEPAEHERQHAGHGQDHEGGEREMIEAVPVPGQLLPVQEHHEIGQDRMGIDAARADLAHQVHAHGVAAEREERAMAERENAAVAPHQIEREREQREAQVLAPQRHASVVETWNGEVGGTNTLRNGTMIAAAARMPRKIQPRPSGASRKRRVIMLPPPGP